MRRSVAVVAVLLAVTGCSDDNRTTIEGSGNVVTETRTVDEFDQISVEGFGKLNVEVGPAVSLTVEAEDNVLQYLITEVRGSTLKVGSDDDHEFRNVEEPVYTITTPSLVKVSIAGSGDVTATGIETDDFDVSIAGSGDVITPEVVVGSFDVSISGSGDVEPTGTTTSLGVSINGSGNFRGEGLVVADAEVDINGSGDVTVNASDTLDVSINGSGSVRYLGDPEVTQSVDGSGSVSRA